MQKNQTLRDQNQEQKVTIIEPPKISNRVRFSLGLSGIILILALVLIISYTGIQFYTIYTSTNLQEKAIQYAVDTEAMLEITFSDNSAIGFNVNPGSSPSILNSSSGSATTVKVVPRGYMTEYYKTSNGTILTPYSSELEGL